MFAVLRRRAATVVRSTATTAGFADLGRGAGARVSFAFGFGFGVYQWDF